MNILGNILMAEMQRGLFRETTTEKDNGVHLKWHFSENLERIETASATGSMGSISKKTIAFFVYWER